MKPPSAAWPSARPNSACGLSSRSRRFRRRSLPSARKPEAPVTTAAAATPADPALERKNRELQAELEESRKFGRQVEDTLNKVTDEKARNEKAAKAELDEARAFGAQVETTLNRVTDEKVRNEKAAKAELDAARAFGTQVETTLNKVTDQKTALETELAATKQTLAAKSAAPSYPDLSGRVANSKLPSRRPNPPRPPTPTCRARSRSLKPISPAPNRLSPRNRPRRLIPIFPAA